MSKIILRGYYGKGNLGDDILMITSFHLAEVLFPNSEILICSDGPDSIYIKNLLGNVRIIKSNDRIDAEWMVHGGGGVYFDFQKGALRFALLNFLIRLISYERYRRVYFFIQSLRGNIGVKAKVRIGWGIGVGTYTYSAKKLYADVLSLVDYKLLIVRDKESIVNLKQHKISYPVFLATDLAFDDRFWNKNGIQGRRLKCKTIGIILRDWPKDDHLHLRVMLEVVKELEIGGYNLRFFSFDHRTDKYYTDLFSNYDILKWDPLIMSLDSFITQLSEVGWVISSRAHGCIVSTCLGIPCVCIGIEPKLKQVAEMLSHSSCYISQPFDQEIIREVILKFINDQSDMRSLIEEDLSINRIKIMDMIKLLNQVILNTDV